MTATTIFIKDAIRGSSPMGKSCPLLPLALHMRAQLRETASCPLSECSSTPLAWQAVGKTRGWKKDDWIGTLKRFGGGGEAIETLYLAWNPWQFTQHGFFDHRAAGKTINQALRLLEA